MQVCRHLSCSCWWPEGGDPLSAAEWWDYLECGRAENSWGLGACATESKLSPCSPSCTCVGSTVKAGSPASANSSTSDLTEDWGCGWWGTGEVGETETERGQVTFSVLQESSEQRLKLCGRGQETITRGLVKLAWTQSAVWSWPSAVPAAVSSIMKGE